MKNDVLGELLHAIVSIMLPWWNQLSLEGKAATWFKAQPTEIQTDWAKL